MFEFLLLVLVALVLLGIGYVFKKLGLEPNKGMYLGWGLSGSAFLGTATRDCPAPNSRG